MTDSITVPSADALLSLLKASLSGDGLNSFGYLVLYTSFGVVRGRTGFTFAQELLGADSTGNPQALSSLQVIELNDVTVEHYSNHMPTASFDRFYMRLGDVQGFALLGSQAQGKS